MMTQINQWIARGLLVLLLPISGNCMSAVTVESYFPIQSTQIQNVISHDESVEWQLLKEQQGIKVFSRIAECKGYTKRVFKVENTTDVAVACIVNLTSLLPTFGDSSFELKLAPGSEVHGDCESDALSYVAAAVNEFMITLSM